MFRPFSVKKAVVKDNFCVTVRVTDNYGKVSIKNFLMIGGKKPRSRANFLAMLLNAAWAFWILMERE